MHQKITRIRMFSRFNKLNLGPQVSKWHPIKPFKNEIIIAKPSKYLKLLHKQSIVIPFNLIFGNIRPAISTYL